MRDRERGRGRESEKEGVMEVRGSLSGRREIHCRQDRTRDLTGPAQMDAFDIRKAV